MTARKITPRKPGAVKVDKLDDETRAEIVTRLACYDTVGEIHTDIKARGIEISHQAISKYNPLNNGKLAQRWLILFDEARTAYHAELSQVHIANRVYRLRRLQRLYTQAEKRGAITVAAGLLEQAAREVGGQFTNVTKTKGAVEHHHVHEITPDEKRNMLEDRLKQAMARLPRAQSSH